MTKLTMHFLPDEPIQYANDDLLGFSEFVDLIENAVQHTQSPFVYGVLGDWGVGKTSILRLLQARYGSVSVDERTIVPIWFNAWAYENESNLIYPLLYAVKQAFEALQGKGRTMPEGFQQALRDVTLTSALVVGNVGLSAALKWFTGDAVTIKDIRKQLDAVQSQQDDLEAIFNTWTDSVGKLKKAFKTLLDEFAKTYAEIHSISADNVHFLILIDDLDRCLPDTTIAILESIKNYLAVERAIFVLGLNAQVVYQGIRHKYGNVQINGREYLEKILNYTFYVPEPELDAVRDFASERLELLLPDEDERAEYAEHFKTFGRVLEECKFNNPRKIKRILNRYLLFLSKYSDKLDDYHMPNIVRLLIIAEYFPQIFQLMLYNTSGFLKEFKKIGSKPLDEYEKKYGISLKQSYSKLSMMRSLFDDLREEKNVNKPKLREQVQDVFSITRLI